MKPRATRKPKVGKLDNDLATRFITGEFNPFAARQKRIRQIFSKYIRR